MTVLVLRVHKLCDVLKYNKCSNPEGNEHPKRGRLELTDASRLAASLVGAVQHSTLYNTQYIIYTR